MTSPVECAGTQRSRPAIAANRLRPRRADVTDRANRGNRFRPSWVYGYRSKVAEGKAMSAREPSSARAEPGARCSRRPRRFPPIPTPEAVAPDCGRLRAGQEVAPLEQEDALAGGGQLLGEGPAVGAGADDDDVMLIGRVLTLLESGGR